ncbi:hemerythrin domain-containing protein [Mitsuaria sp. WAJ17]|uniref:hemerythrin domain-containing protein n=1 Tax=Mitsuaria sp. WAJ17 TaxID=2761452 RepID=UPI001600E481|nr:hemerythrin domain-containing protein [Mitsuaria sp. WAJ17]MBB2488006.1 hemerythrin domain-containing protein [Mitsuaria sp. WAJ17]
MPTPQSASSPTLRKSGRPASKARNELLAGLKEDHQRVRKAYSKYRRLDAQEDAETRQELLQLILDELSVHARLEEELLYPAAREELADCSQVDEAEVEHEMLHLLISQLRGLDPEQESHEAEQLARFTVLCEYTLHHVKEEEREMFPQLMKAKLDWLGLARDFKARRAELKGESPDQGDPRGPRGRRAGNDSGDDVAAVASSGEEKKAADAEAPADKGSPPDEVGAAPGPRASGRPGRVAPQRRGSQAAR